MFVVKFAGNKARDGSRVVEHRVEDQEVKSTVLHLLDPDYRQGMSYGVLASKSLLGRISSTLTGMLEVDRWQRCLHDFGVRVGESATEVVEDRVEEEAL